MKGYRKAKLVRWSSYSFGWLGRAWPVGGYIIAFDRSRRKPLKRNACSGFDDSISIASAKEGIADESSYLEQNGPSLARFRQV